VENYMRINSFVDSVICQSKLVNSPTISIVDPLQISCFSGNQQWS
jgi:hypothetical protein